MTTKHSDDKAIQNPTTDTTRTSQSRKQKSDVIHRSVVPTAQIEPQTFKVGQRVKIIATNNIGKITAVVENIDDVVVNECRVNGLWYRFGELNAAYTSRSPT